MVCIPCIVIPVVLWIFHKYIQPLILKFWNPWAKKSVTAASNEAADGSSLDAALRESDEYKYIQKMVKDNPVMVFSKTTCSYCSMAKKVLDDIGVNYTVEEIDRRPDTAKLQEIFAKITDSKTVPRVFIGGKCIGGGTDTISLHNQRLLVPMMKEAGATFKKSD
jgi:glutaredoxin 3